MLTNVDQVKPQVKSQAHIFGQVKPQVKSGADKFGQVKPLVKPQTQIIGQVKLQAHRWGLLGAILGQPMLFWALWGHFGPYRATVGASYAIWECFWVT